MLRQNKINDGADLVHIESGVIYRLVIEVEGPNPQLHFISYLLKLKADSYRIFYILNKEEREK